MRVLIIEDNKDIAVDIYEYLGGQGHIVDHAADGVTGLHLSTVNDYDALVLDLGLPGMDGRELCRRLREDARRDTPVLMLTARDTLDDKLAGFASGADDYLVKPFALKELLARLTALNKRRRGRIAQNILQVGDLIFDPANLTVTRAGLPVKLPPKCLRLLEAFMQSPNKVFSRVDLETEGWGEPQTSSDTLRSHMHLLRRALAQPKRPDPIENVHGLGYRLAIHENTR
jgi:DNA-binding response OmpR family regulator